MNGPPISIFFFQTPNKTCFPAPAYPAIFKALKFPPKHTIFRTTVYTQQRCSNRNLILWDGVYDQRAYLKLLFFFLFLIFTPFSFFFSNSISLYLQKGPPVWSEGRLQEVYLAVLMTGSPSAFSLMVWIKPTFPTKPQQTTTTCTWGLSANNCQEILGKIFFLTIFFFRSCRSAC